MSIEVRVPTLPESVADAQLVAWQKQPGDTVSRDENLVEIETDKVVLEVPAPADGVLEKIVAEDGTTVTAGEVIAIIGEGSGTETSAPAASEAPAATSTAIEAETGAPTGGALGPAARRLVEEHGVDASKIPGTGKDGRVTKADVQAFVDKQSNAAATPAAAPKPAKEPAPSAPAPATPATAPSTGERTQRREPMTRLRARIAERLVEAQQNAAILTTFNEVNMKPAMDLRKKYKDEFEKVHGVRLGFMSFFVKACCEALKKYPAVNAFIDGKDIVYNDFIDIGVAVGSPRGLVVPVLRDADRKGFAQIEGEIAEYGRKAQEGSLSMDELTGGTFTVSNGGVFGSMLSTPILNPPQSGILGMHNIVERAVVENGEIVARPMMYIALSYDHRIIDGKEAVSFLVTVKKVMEDPARMLLGV
ncbi:MAG: 2-oxoglutarate dehydrogenase complex dihydrolipoyllysine-residue succinyltransferase [Gammaproteobacteria bacterium]